MRGAGRTGLDGRRLELARSGTPEVGGRGVAGRHAVYGADTKA